MEDKLVELFAVSEVFVDGFDGYEVKDGVLSCTGYREKKPNPARSETVKVAVLRIVMPVANLGEVITRATEAAKGLPLIEMMRGTASAH